jgi:hypothetical protein
MRFLQAQLETEVRERVEKEIALKMQAILFTFTLPVANITLNLLFFMSSKLLLIDDYFLF